MMLGSLLSDVAVNVLVIIAILSFVGAQAAQWRATKQSEDQLKSCRERVRELEQTNFDLMQRLLGGRK